MTMDRRRFLRGAAGGAIAAAGLTRWQPGVLAQEATPAGGEIVVADALGEVTLPGPAQRVVALEWTYVEDVLAVGVQPVGVADIEGYDAWVNIPPQLDADVTDVGLRQEPSLESIAALEPDLIIGPLFRLETVRDTLNSIAPTLLFEPYPEGGDPTQYEEMIETQHVIAAALGKAAEGERVIEAMTNAFAVAAEAVDAAGLAGAPVVLAQAFSSENTPQIRLFIDNAMAVEELAQIGLVNAYSGSPDRYGFNTVGVEALVEVQDANFLYVVQDDDDVFAEQLHDNPVWSNLNFVKEGRTYNLGGDTWVFGGPLSGVAFVNRVVERMTGTAPATPTA